MNKQQKFRMVKTGYRKNTRTIYEKITGMAATRPIDSDPFVVINRLNKSGWPEISSEDIAKEQGYNAFAIRYNNTPS